MNSFEFSGHDTARPKVLVVPGIAPWFGYTVGSVVMIAALTFIVEVIRVEMIVSEAKQSFEKVETRLKK